MRELNVNEINQVKGGLLILVPVYKGYVWAHEQMNNAIDAMTGAWANLSGQDNAVNNDEIKNSKAP